MDLCHHVLCADVKVDALLVAQRCATVQNQLLSTSLSARSAHVLKSVEKATAPSILVLGHPGTGKTTVIREICRKLSQEQVGGQFECADVDNEHSHREASYVHSLWQEIHVCVAAVLTHASLTPVHVSKLLGVPILRGTAVCILDSTHRRWTTSKSWQHLQEYIPCCMAVDRCHCGHQQ